jgi:hypothetical protein
MHGRVVANVQFDRFNDWWRLENFTLVPVWQDEGEELDSGQPLEPQGDGRYGGGANLVLGAMDADVWACWRAPHSVETSWGLRCDGVDLLDVRSDGLVAVCSHETGGGVSLYRPGDMEWWKHIPTGPIRADAVAGRRNFRMAGDEAVYEEHGVGVKRISLVTGEQLPVGARADVSGLPVIA